MKKNKLSSEEKILKNKIEEADFDYQASDWESLEQKLPTKQGLQFTKWLVASTAVVLISSAAYFLSSDRPTIQPEKSNAKELVSESNANKSEAKEANTEGKKEETLKISNARERTNSKDKNENNSSQINTPNDEKDLANSLAKIEKNKTEEQSKENTSHELIEKNALQTEVKSLDFKELNASIQLEMNGKGCVGERIELIARSGSINPSNLIWEHENIKRKGGKIDFLISAKKPLLISLFYQDESSTLTKLRDTLINPGYLPESDFAFSEDTDILTDFQVALKAKKPESSNSYQWFYDDKLISEKSSFTHNFNAAGNYTVTLLVSSKNGCEASATKNIKVKDDHKLFINVFTPNGDGYLDTFMPQGFEDFKGNFSFKVYNLQNNLLYETNSPVEGWNGRIKNSGEMQNTGLYVWEIKISDNKGNFRAFSDKVTIRK